MCRKNQFNFIANLALLLLLLLHMQAGYAGKQSKVLLFRRIETNHNPKYVNDFHSNITADRLGMNMALTQIASVPVDYWMSIGITCKPKNTKKYRPVVSFNINICSLLSNELNQHGLLHSWMKDILKYSNMPRKCPWKADTYYLRNFRPEGDSIPPFISAGVYRIDSKFYLKQLNNALFANMTIFVEVQ